MFLKSHMYQGDIRDKDYCEMVHVEVKSRFVVTCGTLVEEDNAWTEIPLSQTTVYYYNSKALIDPLPVSGIHILPFNLICIILVSYRAVSQKS